MTLSRYSICMTELATEMPRCFSISIQSEVAWRALLRPFTVPARRMAPANSSSFSVSVVLPASGWEMIAKVRRRAASAAMASRIGAVAPSAGTVEGDEVMEIRGRVKAPAECGAAVIWGEAAANFNRFTLAA